MKDIPAFIGFLLAMGVWALFALLVWSLWLWVITP